MLDTVENQLEEFDDVTCEKLQGDQDLKEYVSDSLALIDVYERLKTWQISSTYINASLIKDLKSDFLLQILKSPKLNLKMSLTLMSHSPRTQRNLRRH